MRFAALVLMLTLAATSCSDDRKYASEPVLPSSPNSAVDSRGASLKTISGTLRLEVEDYLAASQDLPKEVQRLGGSIAKEVVSQSGDSVGSAVFTVRIPPAGIDSFISWMAKAGEITYKEINAVDVTKEFFDSELALKNLNLELEKFRQILNRPNIVVADVLAVEKELSRIQAEIEKVKGNQQFLKDRIDMALITVSVYPKTDPYANARSSTFRLGVEGFRAHFSEVGTNNGSRDGWGLLVGSTSTRSMSFNMRVLPKTDTKGQAATIGFSGQMYSKFFGAGRRSYLNPFIGYDVGAISFGGDRGAFIGALIGIELIRFHDCRLELFYQGQIIAADDLVGSASTGGTGFSFPF